MSSLRPRAFLRAVAVALLLAALVIPSGAVAAEPKPAHVALRYDCSNMRDPQLGVIGTRHVSVEFTRLGKYRWRLRAYPDIGHPIRTNLWEVTSAKRLETSRGRLVRSVMEWTIPIKVLDGC